MTKTQENALRLLGLCASEANQEAIKKAYRKACSKFHPDRGGSKEMMQAVNEAEVRPVKALDLATLSISG